jgi:hypothetical protein
MRNRVEVYKGNSQDPFAAVDAEFQPSSGDLINIRGVTWEVIGRSFTIDDAGGPLQRMRCNVIVKENRDV